MRSELPSEDLPGYFEAHHGAVHVISRKMKPFGQFSHRRRPDAFHPAEHDGIERRIITALKNRFDLRPMFRRHPSPYFLRLTLHMEFDRTPFFDQARQVDRPVLCFLDRQPEQRQQGVVQFIRIAHDGPGLPLYFLNRCRVQGPDLAGQLSRQRAPHFHRPRPPLLQRRIVEKRIGVGIQDLVRERRRHGVSTATQRMVPASICLRSAVNPSRSIASVKQSRRVSLTSG